MAALNLDLFWDNIDTKCTLWSDVPSDVGSRECILGIDEAGRGPVLGDVTPLHKYHVIILVFDRSDGLWSQLLSSIHEGSA